MKHLADSILHRKALFYFLFVAMAAAGILAYQRIGKLEDPELVVMQSQIVTVYPGASAHEVEMQVTNVIEEQLNTLANVESIRSKSMPNLSVVSVSLELSVPQDEIEQRWDYLRRRMTEVQPKLPEGAFAPMIFDDFGDVYGMFYAMTAEGFSYDEMSRMAHYIQRELLAVDGVARVEIYGEQQPVTEVVFAPSAMAEMGIFPLQLMATLQGQTATVYPGPMQTGQQRIPMAVDGQIKSTEDVANTLIKSLDGTIFKLSDIASVRSTYAEPLRNTLSVNNQKAIGISLSMESGENIIEVGKRVEKRLAELRRDIPVGYNFEKVFFQPDLVKNSIDGFMLNLIESVAIVILVLMLTMGLKSGLIIGAGLILTVLATFPVLLATDGTLQRISLGAFIVAMGMLVDNAIVVLDGILVNFKKGVKKPAALIQPVKKTAIPLLGATFIAFIAFVPVYLAKDAVGKYARDLFVVLCISLLISWLLAMVQVPLFANRFIRPKALKEGKDLFNNAFYRLLRKTLQTLLHYKTATLIVSALLLALAGLNFQNIKKTFFPDFNYNQAYIEYRLPAGTSPQQVNDDLRIITEHLLSLQEVKMVVSSQGQTPSRYCLVRPMGEGGDHYGELIVNFKDYETMIRMRPVIADYLHSHFPDSRSRIRKYNLSIKSSHTVEAEFSGPDPAVLKQLSLQAKEIFRKNPYVDQYTLEDNWEPLGEVLTARYAEQAARRAGASRQDVSLALLTASDGLPVGSYHKDQSRVDIVLKLRNADGSRIEKPEGIPVWNMLPNISEINERTVQELLMGIKTFESVGRDIVSPVPLSSLTNGIDLDWEEPVVHRVNGRRALQVQCDPFDDISPAITLDYSRNAIEAIELPEGYRLKWVGEHELQAEALNSIFKFMPIPILLIILTLILLFNDYRKPLIILLCIPMAFTGIVPGMILAGQPFTFMAIIGSFGLMGMIIKNAIVLIDEIEGLRASGSNTSLALVDATIIRTRPVLLASVTTILGMLPLLTDPMYASMAVAIISGLIVGTMITLIFVPVLYAVFYKVQPAPLSFNPNDSTL